MIIDTNTPASTDNNTANGQTVVGTVVGTVTGFFREHREGTIAAAAAGGIVGTAWAATSFLNGRKAKKEAAHLAEQTAFAYQIQEATTKAAMKASLLSRDFFTGEAKSKAEAAVAAWKLLEEQAKKHVEAKTLDAGFMKLVDNTGILDLGV